MNNNGKTWQMFVIQWKSGGVWKDIVKVKAKDFRTVSYIIGDSAKMFKIWSKHFHGRNPPKDRVRAVPLKLIKS